MTAPSGGSPSLTEQFTYRARQSTQTVVVTGITTYTDTYVYSQHGMPLELLRTTSGGTNRYWYQRDGLGNVAALTDVSGSLVGRYAYIFYNLATQQHRRLRYTERNTKEILQWRSLMR